MRTVKVERQAALFGRGLYIKTDCCQRHCCLFSMTDSFVMDSTKAQEKCPRFRRVWERTTGDKGDTGYRVDCADSVEESVALEMME